METGEDESVGKAIKMWRTLRKLNQSELAEQMTDAGYPMQQQTVWKIEKGLRSVRLVEAAAMAEIFEVDLGHLCSPSETAVLVRRIDFLAREVHRRMRDTARIARDAEQDLQRLRDLLADASPDVLAKVTRPIKMVAESTIAEMLEAEIDMLGKEELAGIRL